MHITDKVVTVRKRKKNILSMILATTNHVSPFKVSLLPPFSEQVHVVWLISLSTLSSARTCVGIVAECLMPKKWADFMMIPYNKDGNDARAFCISWCMFNFISISHF